MQVKNVSSRPHHVADVLIAPGETKTIPEVWANSINKAELIEVVEKAEKPAKKSKTEEVSE
jgi:hypothetical protein